MLDARRVRKNRRVLRLTEEELLAPLRGLLEEKGRLSLPLIASTLGMPNHASYRRRYGSLDAAYARVGYIRPIKYPCPPSQKTVDRIAPLMTEIVIGLKQSGLLIRKNAHPGLLTINRTHRIAIAAPRLCTGLRDRFWEVRVNPVFEVDYVLACLLNAGDQSVQAHYLLPANRFPRCGKIRILDGGKRLEPYRLTELANLGELLDARS